MAKKEKGTKSALEEKAIAVSKGARKPPSVTPSTKSTKKGRKGIPSVKPKKKKSASTTLDKAGASVTSEKTEETRDIKDTPYSTYGSANDRQFVLSERFNQSVDPLMNSLNRYWTSNNNSLSFTLDTTYVELDSMGVGIAPFARTETIKAIPKAFSTDVADAASLAVGNIAAINQTSNFFEALKSIQYSSVLQQFEVYNFAQRVPIQYPSYHGNHSVINVDISFVYNYELNSYEELIGPASFDETKCLNFYVDEPQLRDAYTKASAKIASRTASRISRRDTLLSKNSRLEFDQELTNLTLANAGAKHTIISDQMLEKLRARNERLESGKMSLPFYVKIDIDKPIEPPDNITEINEIIFEDGSIFADIAAYCADISDPGSRPELSRIKSFVNSNWDPSYKNAEQTQTELNFGIQDNNLTLIDAIAMSTELINNSSPITTPPTKQFYQPPAITSDPTTGSSIVTGYAATSTLDASTTSGKIETVNYTGLEDLRDELESMEKMPEFQYTYSELLANAKRPSTEVIMYRIAKYDSEDSTTPIHNIWLPRKDDKQITYIDFQVKYGKRYVYKVSAYKFIVGTKYSLTVTNPVESSYFGKVIENYYEMRNNLTVMTQFGEYKLEYDQTIDESIERLLDDLDDVIDDPSERISNAKEDLGSTKQKSFGLRSALRAMLVWLKGREWSDMDKNAKDYSNTGTTSTFDKARRQIEEEIETLMGSASSSIGYTVDAMGGISGDEKEVLQSILDSMTAFEDEGDRLIRALRRVLASEDGLGDGTSKTKKQARKDAAETLKTDIEAFLDKEDEMLTLILSVTATDVKKGYIEGTKIITYSSTPVIDLVEFPYYEDAGAILDNPPVFPDVNFVPYKGVDNKLGLFLNSGIGQDILVPINVNPQDAAYISLFRESRKYNDLEPIPFKSDETKNMAATFEIYRLSSPPHSYADFQSAGIYETISEKFKNGLDTLPSVSHVDTLKPNQTYYYMFRSVDVRGNRSNPSQVFSVTLINENGMVFPLINHYEFPGPPSTYTKQFKKLLNFVPSINQVSFGSADVPSYEAYKDKDNINGLLGTDQKRVFGNTFKVRVTSKKTGKQLDLNITFDSEIE